MSFTVNSMVFKVFLPILVGLAIMGTLDSIKVNSLDNQTSSLSDTLNSFDRKIVLAETQEESGDQDVTTRARDKYRQAVIFNVLAAQHCGLIGKAEEAEPVNDYGEFGDDFLDNLVNDFQGGNVGSEIPLGPETEYESKIYYPGDKPPYEVLRESNMPLNCAGADQISSNVPGISQMTQNEGNDMEGRYGRIDFEVENTFTIRNPDVAAFSFPGIENDGDYPSLLLGMKAITAVPDGCEDNFYDSKVRMQNVPIIITGGSVQEYNLCNYDDLSELHNSNSNSLTYTMCENATGYIQTNVGNVRNSGEATTEADIGSFIAGAIETGESLGIIGDTSNFKQHLMDVETYPKLLIRENPTGCIDGGSSDDGRDLTVPDTADVIGPKLDFGSRREKCSYGDVENYKQNDRSSSWQGIDVKCGMVEKQTEGDNQVEYYETVWYAEEVCAQDAEILEIFETVKGENIEYGEEGVSMGEGGGIDRIRYDLLAFSNTQEIKLNYDHLTDSTVSRLDVYVNGNELKISSIYNDPDYDGYRGSISFSGNEVTAFEQEVGRVDKSYSLVINPSEDTLKWDWEGGTYEIPRERENEIPDEINSIEVEYQGATVGDKADIKSLKISNGGSEC